MRIYFHIRTYSSHCSLGNKIKSPRQYVDAIFIREKNKVNEYTLDYDNDGNAVIVKVESKYYSIKELCDYYERKFYSYLLWKSFADLYEALIFLGSSYKMKVYEIKVIGDEMQIPIEAIRALGLQCFKKRLNTVPPIVKMEDYLEKNIQLDENLYC